MREDEDSNWFLKWEEELPSPEELMPLSQTLITPDLALAFDIPNNHHHLQPPTPPPPPPPPPTHPPPLSQAPNSGDFDSSSAEMGGAGGGGGGGSGGGGGGGEEPARTLKRPRLVWTPQLHKRFVDAVAHLGIKNAVPKTIMQLMSVDGLTRENVASHLQKYRLYLKRMQRINSGAVGGAGLTPTTGDPATDHLFASAPVPPHFLHQGAAAPAPAPGGRGSSEHFVPYMPPPQVTGLHHHQQMSSAAAASAQMPAATHYQNLHHRQMGHFGSPPSGHFEHPFSSRVDHISPRINGGLVHSSMSGGGFADDLESGTTANARKVLTLFPAGDV
ncbi:Transcription factor mybc1 [Dionaea muscipula]